MSHVKLAFFIFPLMASAVLASESAPLAHSGFKRYPIASATILYDVNTTGESAGLKTHTLGVARLVFDHWGAREVQEEDSTEIQSGDFNETRNRRSLSKIDYGTVYSVDYDENITYKTRDRDMDTAIAEGKDLSGENFAFLQEIHAVKVGTETIVGLVCDLWKGKDQEVCLYQGIPLRITVTSPGFRSSRTAVYAVVNKPIAEREFALPNFPIIIDDDYTSNASALTRTEDYIAAVGDLHAALKGMAIDLNDTNRTLSPQEEKTVINVLGKRYLEKQKQLLPGLKNALFDAQSCIRDANSSRAAQSCIRPVNVIDEKLGDKTENFIYTNWDDTKRQKILRSLKGELKYLDVTLKCVQEHNQTTDVITCTEGSLDSGE
jgi:hypothetical protein